jgi:hypothetical protein
LTLFVRDSFTVEQFSELGSTSVPGYIKNSFLLPRGEEVLFNDDGRPTLDSYAIIPMEVFDAMGGLRHPACKLSAMWALNHHDKRRNGNADQEDFGPDTPAG